jgi:hypothetical protein
MVVIPTRAKAPAPARVPEPTPAPIIDDSIITQPSKSSTSQLPAPPEIIVTPPGEKEVEAPIHPFAQVRETSYLPPHERTFPNRAKDTAYHTHAPVHNPAIANDVYQRTMKSPCVTLTPEELFSISPEVRGKVRESVTPKRTPNEPVAATHMFTEPSNEKPIIVPDYYETFYNNLLPDKDRPPIVVAKESHALRSIALQVNNQNFVKGVVDPGSQIIAMSEGVCHKLGLAYDPTFLD